MAVVLEVQFTGSLPLDAAEVEGLDDEQLAELIQDQVGHTGVVVLNADGPAHLLRASRRNDN